MQIDDNKLQGLKELQELWSKEGDGSLVDELQKLKSDYIKAEQDKARVAEINVWNTLDAER